MTTTPKCHWNPDLGWLTPEHRADCKDECKGCRPCAKTHCALFGRCANHVDVEAGIVTCPGCIGRVRGDLNEVLALSGKLLAEAIVKGVDSEAAALHGPAANPEAWSWRKAAGRVVEDDDENHPYLVLGRWDLMLREEYGPATDLEITIRRSHDYLDGQVSRLAQDEDQDFEQFARELRHCRTHLETVLGDSRTPERGVACPTCRLQDVDDPPRLVKRYGRTEDEDSYHCPRNEKHEWSQEDYRRRVGATYLVHAEKLTASQISEAHGIPASTIRRWASPTRRILDGEVVELPPQIRSVGKSHDGRNLYSVEVVLALKSAKNPEDAGQVA